MQYIAYYKSFLSELKGFSSISLNFLTHCPHNGINAPIMETMRLFGGTTGMGTGTTSTHLTRDGWAEQARTDSSR